MNFDDFLLHDSEPACVRAAGVPEILAPDPVLHAGLPPAEAAQAMSVPPGFAVDVIAGEPDVCQPIAFAFDGKGRIWVAEAVSYPWRQKEGEGKDSIVVFSDQDHDGKYETRTVFADHLNLVSGLEVGFGGVFVGAAPYLMFIPDRDDDLKPDGPPEILLDGFGFEDTHETLNAFNWGPDGWLYGCHGVFTHSRVGRPGTPDDQRVPMNAAIWRYHPLRREFEIFAEGTSNPWGVDFDDHGDSFCTACVIPHLYHIIQGGRYIRQAGGPFNPFTYTEIDTIADHRHWAGDGPYAAIGRSDKLGGGHAHAGAMLYLGGAFPGEYRDTIFMGNIHGNRVNRDLLEPKGSGFVGHHGPDFIVGNDKWFRPINEKYGPDGAVYFIDWYDKHACHQTPGELWDRTNGRIYRVRYGELEPRAADLAQLDDRQLVQEHLEKNDWWVRQARKELERRGGNDAVATDLRCMVAKQEDPTRRLRAMWTLAAIDRFTEADAVRAFDDKDPHVRGFGVQLGCEKRTAGKALLDAMALAAERDPSPVVRRFISSALQRLPLAQRFSVLAALITHAEDESDPNLAKLDWYALEPLVPAEPERALSLSRDASLCRLFSLREFIVRRAAADPNCHAALVASVAQVGNAGEQHWMLEQIDLALREQRGVKTPAGWPALYAELKQDPKLEREALDVAIDFGDASALPEARRAVANRGSDAGWRQRALDALVRAQDPQAPALLMAQLGDPDLRGPALRALANFADPKTPAAILGAMKEFNADERRDAMTTLTARADWATELLDALGRNEIARTEFAATVVRRLRDLKSPEVDALITKNFGLVRDTPEEKKKRIEALKAELSPDVLAHADRQNGRALFATICMKCHTLFGTGRTIAPDLTGANRADLDYLVSNVVDPNAVIGKEYQVTNVWLKNGNVVSGILKQENASAVTLIAENDTVTVAKSDIDTMKPSATSLMPEGQLDALPADDVRDLFAYLQSRSQVAIKATAASAPLFFDDQTFSFWSGDPALWSIDRSSGHAEIVGRSASGMHENAFLVSDFEMKDFRLTADVKLVDDVGNSGIQFRTEPLAAGGPTGMHGPSGQVRGCQADVGPGWWGKLYEENGRGILVNTGGESFLNKGDWNHYEIVCTGSRIRMTFNDHVVVDIDDPAAAKSGRIALQLHAGEPMEVRFKSFKLELDPPALPPLPRAAGSQ